MVGLDSVADLQRLRLEKFHCAYHPRVCAKPGTY